MQNVFDIGLVVRGEALIITLSVEATSEHFENCVVLQLYA